ncbi:MAG: hypothetical protein AAFP13_11230 [Pseudomonadota bacterium]
MDTHGHHHWFYLGALLVTAALLYPFTQALYLPLVDLPNHIARHTIMAAEDGSALTRFWTASFVLVPNSAVDLLWQAIGGGDAVVFSHRVMAVAALNLFASGVVLARVVHGRFTAWSLAGGLVVFSVTFLFGFQNYSFSLPFAIHAFALYLVLERRALWLRVLVFAAITPVLFVMHFFAFAVLGALALGRELQRIAETRTPRSLGHAAAMGLPFVVPVLWLLADMATGPENPAGSFTEFGTLQARLTRFAGPLHAHSIDLGQGLNQLATLITFALYGLFSTTLAPLSWGLRVSPVMRGPVLAILAVAVLAPTWLAGVALIDVRFPFVFILVMIAATDWRAGAPRMAAAVTVLAVALIAGRSAQLGLFFSVHDAEMRALTTLMDDWVEPEDRVLPVRAPGAFLRSRHWHVQGYATARNEAFIPTLFQGVHAVQLREEYAVSATPLMSGNPACAVFEAAPQERDRLGEWCHVEDYLEGWETKFNKILAMEPLDAAIVAGAPVRLLGRRGRFEIYEVTAD